MSHFLTFPINENGIILDPNLSDNLAIAMSPELEFTHMFVYSHGWWTSATVAMNDYNRFSLGLARRLADAGLAGLLRVPRSSLGIGIHWPSMLSENTVSLENYFEAASFYTMQKRADTVGEHGVYTLLNLMLTAMAGDGARLPEQINLIGHSFGCRVVCSALQTLSAVEGIEATFAKTSVGVVLLEPAFDNDALDPGGQYGALSSIPNLRMLVSRSDLDTALTRLYPDTHALGNLLDRVRGKGTNPALGAAGPTDATVTAFGGAAAVAVDVGSDFTSQPPFEGRLVVADLTPLHTNDGVASSPLAGHHADIFHDEIYGLIGRFLC